jgi:hypothetical protein
MSNTTNIKVKDLIIGQQFKLSGQHKFRTIKNMLDLSPTGPHAGKKLIVLDTCKQMVLSPELEVNVNLEK